MDLAAEVLRLRLDQLAVDVSRCLTAADVAHAVIKGPSTSLWLYDPPRPYRDVDVLVAASLLSRATQALVDARLATASAGALGEEAPHSLLMTSSDGFELDLHVSLPTVPPSGDRVWDVLAGRLEDLDLGVGRVPVLDAPGRCLVLTLHALNNGPHAAQPVEDLERARARCPSETWIAAAGLAREIGADDLFQAGLALVDRPSAPVLSPRSRLYAGGAPNAAFGLQRLAAARRRDLPRLLWRELIPTAGFLHHADPDLPHTRRALARARVARVVRLARQLPRAVSELRRTRTRSH